MLDCKGYAAALAYQVIAWVKCNLTSFTNFVAGILLPLSDHWVSCPGPLRIT